MSLFDQTNVITTRNITTSFNPLIKNNVINPKYITGSSLATLPDVNIVQSSLADGELLSYEAETQKWTNVQQTPATYPFSLFQALNQKGTPFGYCGLDLNAKVSHSSLNQIDHTTLSNIGTNTHTQIDSFISEFNISSPTNNQLLIYNSSTGKWINENITIDTTLQSLSDTSIILTS